MSSFAFGGKGDHLDVQRVVKFGSFLRWFCGHLRHHRVSLGKVEHEDKAAQLRHQATRDRVLAKEVPWRPK